MRRVSVILFVALLMVCTVYVYAASPDIFVLHRLSNGLKYLEKIEKGQIYLNSTNEFSVKAYIEPRQIPKDIIINKKILDFDRLTLTYPEEGFCLKKKHGYIELFKYPDRIKHQTSFYKTRQVKLSYTLDKPIGLEDFPYFVLKWKGEFKGKYLLEARFFLDTDGDNKTDCIRVGLYPEEKPKLKLIKKIDVKKQPVKQKTYSYLIARELGLNYPDIWQYSFDPPNTVFQKRFNTPLKKCNVLLLVLKKDSDFNGINIFLDTDGNGRKDRLLLYGSLVKEIIPRGDYLLVEIDLKETLKKLKIDSEHGNLYELILFFQGEQKPLLNANPIHLINFYTKIDSGIKKSDLMANLYREIGGLNELEFNLYNEKDDVLWGANILKVELNLSFSPDMPARVRFLSAQFLDKVEENTSIFLESPGYGLRRFANFSMFPENYMQSFDIIFWKTGKYPEGNCSTNILKQDFDNFNSTNNTTSEEFEGSSILESIGKYKIIEQSSNFTSGNFTEIPEKHIFYWENQYYKNYKIKQKILLFSENLNKTIEKNTYLLARYIGDVFLSARIHYINVNGYHTTHLLLRNNTPENLDFLTGTKVTKISIYAYPKRNSSNTKCKFRFDHVLMFHIKKAPYLIQGPKKDNNKLYWYEYYTALPLKIENQKKVPLNNHWITLYAPSKLFTVKVPQRAYSSFFPAQIHIEYESLGVNNLKMDFLFSSKTISYEVMPEEGQIDIPLGLHSLSNIREFKIKVTIPEAQDNLPVFLNFKKMEIFCYGVLESPYTVAEKQLKKMIHIDGFPIKFALKNIYEIATQGDWIESHGSLKLSRGMHLIEVKRGDDFDVKSVVLEAVHPEKINFSEIEPSKKGNFFITLFSRTKKLFVFLIVITCFVIFRKKITATLKKISTIIFKLYFSFPLKILFLMMKIFLSILFIFKSAYSTMKKIISFAKDKKSIEMLYHDSSLRSLYHLWWSVFWATISIILYYIGINQISIGENYWWTSGGIGLVFAYHHLVFGIKDKFLKKFPKAGEYVYRSSGTPYISGFIVILIACAFLLAINLEPIANQLAIIGYYLLVVGVVKEFLEHVKSEGQETRDDNS